MDGVGELVQLALEVAAPAALGRQVPFPLRLRGLGHDPLPLGPYDGHLDVREQLTGTGRDGGGHRRLVPQPGPAPLGAGAGLPLGAGAPVEGVRAAA